MANYPVSLDIITNPTSGNTLDNPSHSLQHSDANDILEALEQKVGIGTSVAGSATAGHALVASTGGTTSWTTIGTAGISSGTATSGQVLTANGSGGVSFANNGLVLINTTSFSGVASQSINDVFSATYDSYRIIIDCYGSINAANVLILRVRVSGADVTTNSYTTNTKMNYAGVATTFDLGAGSAAQSYLDLAHLPQNNSDGRTTINIDCNNPFTANVTTFNGTGNGTRSGISLLGSFITGQVPTLNSYTGFTIIPAAGGTITGRLSVYGYCK